jgi:hypothetical protein
MPSQFAMQTLAGYKPSSKKFWRKGLKIPEIFLGAYVLANSKGTHPLNIFE